MRVKLLGTGSAEGFPGMFCGCPTCRVARERRGRDLRTRSSALVDGVVKIDFPPDTFHHVITGDLDLTAVEYIVFTHSHDDHFAVPELQYMSWMFVPEPASRPLTILGSCDVLQRVRDELPLDILPMRLEVIEPCEPTQIGRHTITGVVANHIEDETCFNYVISDGTASVLYATDTGVYAEVAWRCLAGAHLNAVIMECTKGMQEGGYMAHLSIPDVVRMRDRMVGCGIIGEGTRFVTTHHSHMAGMLYEDLERELSPHGIEVGYDGMTVDV